MFLDDVSETGAYRNGPTLSPDIEAGFGGLVRYISEFDAGSEPRLAECHRHEW